MCAYWGRPPGAAMHMWTWQQSSWLGQQQGVESVGKGVEDGVRTAIGTAWGARRGRKREDRYETQGLGRGV